MIKVMVIDNMGMVIGEVERAGESHTFIHNPLFLAPSAQGNITLQNNPLFDTKLEVSNSYIVASSDPKQSMLDQYDAYTMQKRSGLIVPGANNASGGKIIT